MADCAGFSNSAITVRDVSHRFNMLSISLHSFCHSCQPLDNVCWLLPTRADVSAVADAGRGGPTFGPAPIEYFMCMLASHPFHKSVCLNLHCNLTSLKNRRMLVRQPGQNATSQTKWAASRVGMSGPRPA